MPSDSRLSDLLPWWDFVAPGVVLNTDGSLQATMALVGPDLRWQPPHIQAAMMLQVNNALRQLEPGSALHSETQRSFMVIPPAHETWGHPVARLIDREDRARLIREPLLESRHYVTLSYNPPSLAQTYTAAWLRGEKVRRGEPAWKTFLPSFRATFDHLRRLLNGIMVEVQPLDDEGTWNFLDFCMNMRRRALKLPADTHYMARQLDDESWEPGDVLVRGGRWVRMLTVTSFPPMSVALMLSRLNDLAVEYRWVLRWIPYESLRADKELARAQAAHAFHKRSPLIHWLDRWFGESEGHDDPMATVNSDEVAEARVDLRSGDQMLGALTITVTVWGDTPTEADEKIRSVRALFVSMGFAAEIETINLLSAYMGGMPGVTSWNPKKPTLESINASQLMAVDGVWSGFPWNEHWKCPPLYIAKTSRSNPYRVVPHSAENAAAHLIGFGPNGSGKSGFLARLRVACQAVPGMRDIGLDFKASSRTTTLMLNGTFTDLGKDAVALQPFRHIHRREQRAWAQGWVESWLKDLNQPVTVDAANFIRGALDRLARVEPSGRTMSGLIKAMAEIMIPSGPALHHANEGDLARIRNTQREVLAALKEFEGGILDGDHDFRLSRVHTFELETLFENMRRARPVMRVIHHLIDDQLDGQPMLLWADEWQALLDDRESEEVFKYRLQRLRDKNAMLALFLHEPGVLFDHAVGRTLINNCLNQVFFPNLSAMSEQNMRVLEMFGITERQVHQLASNPPRSGYLWKSEGGTRFVEYLFEPFTLAVCGRSGKRWHREVDRVLAEVGPELFPVAWAESQGFPEQAKAIKDWLEARHAEAAD
jgi:type IV secretory pathway VirB4 component